MQTIKCVVVGDGAVGKVSRPAAVVCGLAGQLAHTLPCLYLPIDVSPDLLYHQQIPVG